MCRTGTAALQERAGRLGGSVMACHRTDRDEACAGYIASDDGRHDLAVRFAQIVGQIPTMEVDVAAVKGGLYPTVRAMRAAHGVGDE